ncbi:nucleotidyltransferase domain-containing protein, partial [Vibrio cholerae O1]|nr:nucleotidyltransferase domain-containing protein [Vibrio cholerae O1]
LIILILLCSQGRATPDPGHRTPRFYRYAQQLFRGFPVLLSAALPGCFPSLLPIDDELDVCGWEWRKGLGLLKGANPTLI